MSNTGAIAAAIALRFGAATTPSGQPNIVESTAALPTVPSLPGLYVFPPEEPDIEHPGAQTRFSVQLYPVRFLLVAEPYDPTDITALHGWHDALQDRILGQFQLGRAGEVAVARLSAIRPGEITFAGTNYLGFDMVVSVTVSEPISPSA